MHCALCKRKEARMRTGILVLGGTLLLGAAATTLAAEVNCKQVNKYLQTGRSVKDVAETMVVSESDVEKCKAQAPADAGTKQEPKMGSEAGEKGAGH
jgi:hypothetical protein